MTAANCGRACDDRNVSFSSQGNVRGATIVRRFGVVPSRCQTATHGVPEFPITTTWVVGVVLFAGWSVDITASSTGLLVQVIVVEADKSEPVEANPMLSIQSSSAVSLVVLQRRTAQTDAAPSHSGPPRIRIVSPWMKVGAMPRTGAFAPIDVSATSGPTWGWTGAPPEVIVPEPENDADELWEADPVREPLRERVRELVKEAEPLLLCVMRSAQNAAPDIVIAPWSLVLLTVTWSGLCEHTAVRRPTRDSAAYSGSVSAVVRTQEAVPAAQSMVGCTSAANRYDTVTCDVRVAFSAKPVPVSATETNEAVGSSLGQSFTETTAVVLGIP
jgi:hypothetical protein